MDPHLAFTAGLLALLAGPATAADTGPRAAFSIDDGCIAVHVTRDGSAPLPSRLRVFVGRDQLWAEGETDEAGRCSIPRPTAATCRVEIDHGGERTPPVVLTFLDGGTAVVPLVAPLTPGPCCRPEKLAAGAASRPPTGWQYAGFAAAGAIPAGLLAFALWRDARLRTSAGRVRR